jgi:hypothetical protein
MKTVLFLLLTIMVCVSCTKEPNEPTNPGNITVILNFGFASSGSITPKNTDSYLDFYNKYITSKILTPKTYEINFYGLNSNHIGTAIFGKWGSKQLVCLPPDRYKVYGTSRPTKYRVCGDTCYFKFNDTITITSTTEDITLKAIYDCSLILFDTTDVGTTKISADTTKWTFPAPFHNAVKQKMMKTEGYYHTFYFDGAANGVGYDKTILDLNITSRSSNLVYDSGYPINPPIVMHKSTDILLWLYMWTSGKYYYFNSTSNGYNLSPMTN